MYLHVFRVPIGHLSNYIEGGLHAGWITGPTEHLPPCSLHTLINICAFKFRSAYILPGTTFCGQGVPPNFVPAYTISQPIKVSALSSKHNSECSIELKKYCCNVKTSLTGCPSPIPRRFLPLHATSTKFKVSPFMRKRYDALLYLCTTGQKLSHIGKLA